MTIDRQRTVSPAFELILFMSIENMYQKEGFSLDWLLACRIALRFCPYVF